MSVCTRWSPLTNVAVLSRPSLVTLTLSLLADSILAAQRVASLLLTQSSRPAFLAPTHAAVAYTVATAVHFTLLCERKYILRLLPVHYEQHCRFAKSQKHKLKYKKLENGNIIQHMSLNVTNQSSSPARSSCGYRCTCWCPCCTCHDQSTGPDTRPWQSHSWLRPSWADSGTRH